MDIAKSLGRSREEYLKLSRRERRMWYYYRILANKKEERSYEKAREEADAKEKMKPKSRRG